MPTTIEWTDETWNPVTGCSKVSQDCKNCYALREWPRLAANPKATAYFGRAFTDVACHPERLDTPLRWTKPRKIFVNSMSDLFHEAVTDAFIDQVMGVMWLCAYLEKGHAFQVLTKRAGRMAAYFQKDRTFEWASAASNISLLLPARILGDDVWDFIASKGRVNPALWLGVSAEDQATADERIPILLRTPAAVRWLSAEPLLGPMTLDRHGNWRQGRGIDWVVVGGESGSKARPMHPHWVFSLRDQCAKAGVPFMFKQWGEWVPRSACYHTFADGSDCASLDMGATQWPCIRMTERGHNGRDLAHAGEGDDAYMQRVTKKIAGRLLQGVLHDGYPAEIA